MDPISAALALANLGGGLFGSLLGRNSANSQQNWIQNALVEVAQRARNGEDWARRMMETIADPALQASLSGINLAGNQLWQGDSLAQDNQNVFNSIPGLFQNNRQFESPATAAARARMEPLADNSAARGDMAFEQFASGGRTPEYQQVFDALSNFLQGRGSNSQLEQQNVASNLLSQRGQTAFTQGVQDRGMDALNQGGMNPFLEFALTEAAKQIQSGGLTPESAQAIQQALQLINTGGETAQTQTAQNAGLNKALQDTVIPLEQLRAMSGDAATSQLKNSLRDIYKDMSRRGGGPGVTIGNGLNSQELSDYLERAGDVRGKAEAGAASAWMDAAQKDAGLGVNLQASAADQALKRFSQAIDLLSSTNNNASNRLSTAFSAIPGTQNSATNIMQILSQAGLGALGAENQRIQIGGGLAGDFNQGINAFANTFGNNTNSMNNFSLGAGGLANNFTNTGFNINNSLYGNDLNAGQLALQQSREQSGALNSALTSRNNLFDIFSRNYNTGIGQLNQQAGMYGDYARATMPNQNPFGAWSRNQNQFQIPSMGGLGGLLGGIFNRGGSSNDPYGDGRGGGG